MATARGASRRLDFPADVTERGAVPMPQRRLNPRPRWAQTMSNMAAFVATDDSGTPEANNRRRRW
jgi:hypothetical protein